MWLHIYKEKHASFKLIKKTLIHHFLNHKRQLNIIIFSTHLKHKRRYVTLNYFIKLDHFYSPYGGNCGSNSHI